MATQKELKSIVFYDEETGVFTRIKDGKPTGSLDNGYVYLCVKGAKYAAHRLAFLYMTGNMPPKLVDHINQDRSDNSWKNLREADYSMNRKNSKMNRNNTTGVSGVTVVKAAGDYLARIIDENGKRLTVYRGKHLHAAKIAMQAAYINHGYHDNHARSKVTRRHS